MVGEKRLGLVNTKLKEKAIPGFTVSTLLRAEQGFVLREAAWDQSVHCLLWSVEQGSQHSEEISTVSGERGGRWACLTLKRWVPSPGVGPSSVDGFWEGSCEQGRKAETEWDSAGFSPRTPSGKEEEVCSGIA